MEERHHVGILQQSRIAFLRQPENCRSAPPPATAPAHARHHRMRREPLVLALARMHVEIKPPRQLRPVPHLERETAGCHTSAFSTAGTHLEQLRRRPARPPPRAHTENTAAPTANRSRTSTRRNCSTNTRGSQRQSGSVPARRPRANSRTIACSCFAPRGWPRSSSSRNAAHSPPTPSSGRPSPDRPSARIPESSQSPAGPQQIQQQLPVRRIRPRVVREKHPLPQRRARRKRHHRHHVRRIGRQRHALPAASPFCAGCRAM
jgi:hypothetical protein